ncbi:MAG: hypothetical protein QOI73_3376 [Solirubrobacteraceae bacterium]|nr:hypothetical protein [Solirubrobacteraceae bacterium]
MPMISERRRSEDGFTLVELLVAMTVSIAVLLGTLQSLDLFSSNAAQQTRVTDANDQVRATMDSTVRDLRGASAILKASASDLVYTVPEASGTRVVRLCVDTGELYGTSTVTTGTPAVPAAACSSGSKLATLKSTASTAFTYDGATSVAASALKDVKNVGLTLSLDASAGGKTGSSTLKASAARRSSGTLPVTDADIDVDCNTSGTALLSLSASLPDYGALTVTYANSGGISLGTPSGNTLTIPAGITTVVATVTDAAGVTNTITKDIECDS